MDVAAAVSLMAVAAAVSLMAVAAAVSLMAVAAAVSLMAVAAAVSLMAVAAAVSLMDVRDQLPAEQLEQMIGFPDVVWLHYCLHKRLFSVYSAADSKGGATVRKPC
ncbi:hypothetical protein ACOMHN_057116 [Nucella lapillus]